MALGGVLVLVGWILDIAFLKSVFPGLAMMKANTALAFVLAGSSLWLTQSGDADRGARRVATACAAAASLIGAATLAEHRFGWNLGIDQLLFEDPPGAGRPAHPGRMAPATALNFVLLGLALLLLQAGRRHWLAQLLSFSAAVASWVALMGYAYGVETLYDVPYYAGMALHAAGAFVVLSLGTLLARPERGLMAGVTSDRPGGVMARRLLPTVPVIPVVVGWLRLKGERTGFYETEFGLALMVTSALVILALLIWSTARSLDRSALERERSESRLRDLIEGAPDAVVISDAEGRIVLVNAQTERLYGYARDELLGRPVDMLLPERLRGAHVGHRADYHAAPRTRLMGGNLNLLARRKDGSEFPVEVSLSPLEGDGGLLVTSVVRDVTEHKRAQVEATQQHRALHEAETRYKSLFERPRWGCTAPRPRARS